MNSHSRWVLTALAVATLAVAPCANASESFDNQRGDIAARVATQNTFQHNGVDSINWVQWRNELRFDLRYDIIQQGVGASWGPINKVGFNFLWRGRYDPVFQLRDSYKDRDYDRGNFEFPEGKTPREVFIDIGFQGALKDLSMRIGKQQVVWGESDLFRSLDIVNPLDITQNGFVGEDFADIRRPLWIAKFLYNFGSVASFWNEAGVEAFFSPNARPEGNQDNIISGETWKIGVGQAVPGVGQNTAPFSRIHAINFRQVRFPWEINRVGSKSGDAAGVANNADGSLSDFMYRIQNDVSTSTLSTSAMMGGVRLLGTTYGNAYFTLNYLFKRTDATSAEVPAAQLFDPTQPGTGALAPGILNRAVAAASTPDLNGNGIPDGQDQQILNCITTTYPTGGGLPPKAAELIIDPGPAVSNPAIWHGSVYSPPGQPQLATGVPAGQFGVPAGVNQLTQVNMTFKPVIGPTTDGLAHNSACLDIPAFHPWTHIIGGTMTYNDYDFTGLVFRLEQSFSTKEPRDRAFNDITRLNLQRDAQNECSAGDAAACASLAPGPNTRLAVPNERDFVTRGKRYTQVWRSMVGFDYLRALSPAIGRKVNNELLRSLLTDQWFFTFQFLNTYDAHADTMGNAGSATNRYSTWNPFFTVSGSGFFLHQKLSPLLAFAADASVRFTPLFIAQIKYFITPKLETRVGWDVYMGSRFNEDPGGLHYYADRDNLFIRLTYYLL